MIEMISTLTCYFLFPGRTSVLGISFGAAFLLLAFILFVCFAGQLLVGIQMWHFFESMLISWKLISYLKLSETRSLLLYHFKNSRSQLRKHAPFRSIGKNIDWNSSCTTKTQIQRWFKTFDVTSEDCILAIWFCQYIFIISSKFSEYL